MRRFQHVVKRRRRVRPIAAFHREPAMAAAAAFDRETGAPVPVEQLATYREVLAQYHLHPEAKFLDGDFTDRGLDPATAHRGNGHHLHWEGGQSVGGAILPGA